jgi:hypothetical protein
MRHDGDKLTSANSRELAEAVAFALRFFEGRKRTRDAEAFRAALAAERVVRHLDRAGFVVIKLQSTAFGAGMDCEGSARPGRSVY